MTSPRTAQRLTRILSMLPWVIANPGATADEVCERFGYTRPELVEDLNLVFVCGLPGYGPGDLMDAYLDEDEVVVDMADYFSRPLRLNAAEGLTLLAAGMALVSSGQASDALGQSCGQAAGGAPPRRRGDSRRRSRRRARTRRHPSKCCRGRSGDPHPLHIARQRHHHRAANRAVVRLLHAWKLVRVRPLPICWRGTSV